MAENASLFKVLSNDLRRMPISWTRIVENPSAFFEVAKNVGNKNRSWQVLNFTALSNFRTNCRLELQKGQCDLNKTKFSS